MKAAAYRRTYKKILTELGVYRPAFDSAIMILCDMREQYDILTARLADGGYQYSESTGQGSVKRHPDVAALENLRKDILTYSDSLGLTPKGLKKLKDIQAEEHKSGGILADVLRELERDYKN